MNSIYSWKLYLFPLVTALSLYNVIWGVYRSQHGMAGLSLYIEIGLATAVYCSFRSYSLWRDYKKETA